MTTDEILELVRASLPGDWSIGTGEFVSDSRQTVAVKFEVEPDAVRLWTDCFRIDPDIGPRVVRLSGETVRRNLYVFLLRCCRWAGMVTEAARDGEREMFAEITASWWEALAAFPARGGTPCD